MNRILMIAGVLGLMACSTTPAPVPAPAAAARAPMATETRDSAMSIADIRHVQGVLKNDGFYLGTVDGVWGPATEAALSQYQMKNNLWATGKYDPATRTAMERP